MCIRDSLSAQFKGNFILSEALEDVNQLLKEYRLFFMGDEATRQAYYNQKSIARSPRLYTINYHLEGRQMTPLLDFLYPTALSLIHILFLGNILTFGLIQRIGENRLRKSL